MYDLYHAVEKRPISPVWVNIPTPSHIVADSIAVSTWVNGPFVVISSLITVEHHSGNVGPEWLISISRRRRQSNRCNSRESRRVLRQFGMYPAEEDNHEPGMARKFWLPVDPAERGVCECKTNEEQVRESDGYTWSRRKSS